MTTLSCLVIEDETILADVLVDYIKQVPFLKLCTVFYDAVTALQYFEENEVDLVFIDINLPKLKGIDFIKMFQGRSKFIITTAYHEYALQGYDLNVVDYLLKPIEFSRFLQAVKKAIDSNNKIIVNTPEHLQDVKDHIFINMNKKRVKVNLNDILYIEGMKEYVKIHLVKDKWLITKLQMGQIQELLTTEFVRVHRSYIVAKKKISSYNLTEIAIGLVVLPVGTNYRESLAHFLEQ